MSNSNTITNVVFAGLGGQGVLKASDIMAETAFNAEDDVKQSEIHGMAQRGGSVSSDVRYGDEVLSPMVRHQGADYLIILDPTQESNNIHRLREGGVLITPATLLDHVGLKMSALSEKNETPLTRRNFNIAMLGVLSNHLGFTEEQWLEAIYANLPEKVHAQNKEVFQLGRQVK